MPVNLSTCNNQDKSYLTVAAAGAGVGYLAKNILPVSAKERNCAESKQLLSEAKRSSVKSRIREYNVIKKEIENGTLKLDSLSQDIFTKNKRQIISGKISDIADKMQVSKEVKDNLDNISQRILTASNKTWDTVMENAEAVAKNTRSALCYALFGALSGMALVALGNSAKTISKVSNKLDVEA